MLYVLHFAEPLGSEKHRARHYAGYAVNVYARFEIHLQGRGAAITRAARLRGIKIYIAAILPGDRNDERRLKRQKNLKRVCPICQRLKTSN